MAMTSRQPVRRPRTARLLLLLSATLLGLASAGCTGGGGDATSEGAPAGGGGQPGSEVAAGTADTESPKEAGPRNDGQARPAESLTRLGNDVLTGRRVVRTAALTVQTQDPSAAARRAEELATGVGGYVADEKTTTEPGRPAYTVAQLVLRVPPDELDGVLTGLQQLGRRISQTRSADDVTEEYVDVEQRLATQRASLQRVRTLLSRAEDIGDVVRLESELTERQADLESLEARLRVLGDRTDLATVTATFEPPPAVAGPRPPATDDRGFFVGLREGWRAFTAAIAVALTVLGAVLPFAVVAAVLWLPARLLARAVRRPRTP
ncbi:MAG: DUF4349 domain-containing protein [Acidothermales bacterium]|nr:DUF4349 domain-containing protein [Acidothermales bacterium]